MRAGLMLARASARRRVAALIGLALVLAIGSSVALTAFEAARRTDQAYPSYLERSRAGDLVVNPSINTDHVEGIIASTPGVASFTSDILLTAGPDPGHPVSATEADNDPTQMRFSPDGRYTEREQPIVHTGRMIRSGAEAFVNDEMAKATGIHVGDVLPLAFFPAQFEGIERPDGVMEPIGRTSVRVVGIGTFGDEMLVDGLYPRRRLLVTPDVANPFNCVITLPTPDDPRTYEEITASAVPAGCSMSHRFFSIRVDGGAAGVAKVAEELGSRFAAENDRLPQALRERGAGFEIIPTVTADERARVQSALRPAVRALQLFGGAAALATLVLVLLGAVRIARRDDRDVEVWREIGATRRMRMAALGLPLGASCVAGLAVAAVVGWLASGTGPVASAKQIEAVGRLGLSGAVVLPVLGGLALLLALGIVLTTAVVARGRRDGGAVTPSRSSRAVGRTGNASLILGVRAATSGAGSRALLAASVAALTAGLATVVFSSSLGALVDQPARFGWPYDAAFGINYGYGSQTIDSDAVAKTFDNPDVRHWATAILAGQVTIKGQPVPSVAERPGFDALHLPVVEGSLPRASDEIALGRQTAARLKLHVGSKVQVGSQFGEREATVSGLVVMPPVGPFQADRASLGTGVLMPAPFFDAMTEQFERDQRVPPGGLGQILAGFLAVDLRPGVDPHRFVEDIERSTATWDSSGTRPFTYAEPVRPATIANVAAMRSVPAALAALLGAAMALGLALAMAVAARARRRELAVFRTLGGVGRQLSGALRWQALSVVAVGLVVGIPLGVAVGRIAYNAFASSIGAAPTPDVPLAWVALVAVGAIAMAVLASAGPGLRAARVSAAEALRTE